jgi:hypothetical protein
MKNQKLYISHRGNLHGPNACLENTPKYIIEAIKHGFDVEIDVWLYKNKWYLGHDEPKVLTDLNFFKNFCDRLWIHCKNLQALSFFIENKSLNNYFWHDTDKYTITSRGYMWCYPDVETTQQSIIVAFGRERYENKICLGICSDYIVNIRDYYAPFQ